MVKLNASAVRGPTFILKMRDVKRALQECYTEDGLGVPEMTRVTDIADVKIREG